MNKPLVSIVIATKNEEKNIDKLCRSIDSQTYKNLEIVLVDNHSSDKTLKIASNYTSKIFSQGPERSSQRNYGVEKSNGKYVLILDADMTLSKKVIEECISRIESNQETVGIIIPEVSVGEGFWSECRKLEKEFYVGEDQIEAARFFKKTVFEELDGFDTNLVSGEDWDLSNRASQKGTILRCREPLYHHDGTVNLIKMIKKKFYYGQKLPEYTKKISNQSAGKNQMNIFSRYKMFLSKPKKLFRRPLIGLGLLFLKTIEFSSIALGMVFANPNETLKIVKQNLSLGKTSKKHRN